MLSNSIRPDYLGLNLNACMNVHKRRNPFRIEALLMLRTNT
jgi:hypothetical protein